MSDTKAAERDEFFESLLGDFLDESAQLLDRLNENLLQLDEWVRNLDEDQGGRCDDDLLNDMFRSAHSLKGLSAMLGLSDINHLTHKVENVFDAARKDELSIDGDIVELIFQAVDRLGSLVDALKEPDAEPVECESVVSDIARLLRSAGVERKQTSQADAERALQTEMATDEDEKAAACDESTRSKAPEATETAEPPSQPAVETEPEPQVDYFKGVEDECECPAKYLSIFIDETEMSLDQLTEALLASEGEGGSETVEVLLVTSHRIKGSAASLGLNRAAKLAHMMEDLLQNLADTGRPLSPEVTDALLKCTDALRHYVEGLKHGTPEVHQFNQVAHELLSAEVTGQPAAETPRKTTTGSEQPPTPSAGEQEAGCRVSDELREKVGAVASDPDATLVGAVAFEEDLPLVGLKAQLLYEKLSNLGDICVFSPPVETLDEVEKLDGISFGVTTEKPLQAVQRALRVAGVQEIHMEPLVSPKPSAPAKTPKDGPEESAAGPAAQQAAAKTRKSRTADGGARPTETLRVDIERLDQLMNLAGQLVINKARFAQIGNSLKAALTGKQSSQVLKNALVVLGRMADGEDGPGEEAALQAELKNLRSQARRIQHDLESVRRDFEMLTGMRTSVNDLLETIHQLDRVSDGIQQSVMDTRMLPIGPLFARFKRVIRDITRSNGKDIKLVINGEKTELDKRMIDELGDPLIHMVRNSADHGIELPEVREAAGKPRQGTVTLDAFHRGNSIIIRVSDDGKGLDPQQIRRKALERGLYTEAELEKMTRHQIYQLIWEPGLSTAEKVTQVSGRGMGMDIVKSKIEELNGTVDLESEPGQGTTLTIKLPLTLAILPSLMVEINGDIYALPLESVAEIVSLNRRDLTTVHGQWTARVRGRVISTVRLDDVLTFNRHGQDTDQNEEATLVIIGEEGRELGLEVNRVLGEEDVVIKSMAENYRNVAGIAGASILGDGRVALILDLAALIDMAARKNTSTVMS